MKQIINCLKHKNPVIKKKLKEVTLEEGEKIAAELFNILAERKDGIGLAASQVGIDAAVAVVNVREPIALINPKILSTSDEIAYYEGCLSFPGKGVNTTRFETVEITSDNIEGSLIFSGCETQDGDSWGTWEEQNNSNNDRDMRMLEAVAIQHEIDHLNGVVCMDRRIDMTIRRTEPKLGRNDLCSCGSKKKYKKCCLNKN